LTTWRSKISKVYQAIPGLESSLERELQDAAGKPLWERIIPSEAGSLYLCPEVPDASPGGQVFWVRNVWNKPVVKNFTSIGEAAGILRAIQRNWFPALPSVGGFYRRGALIAQKLPPVNTKPHPFPWLLPASPMGAWTLLDGQTLLASADCTSPFPGGVAEFQEDREGPPSRAYLKLWEALVRARAWPGPGDYCFDAGASPGGWTWALARLGAQVLAVDRAPLEARVAAMPGVSFRAHDAFTLPLEEIVPAGFTNVSGAVWVCCDVACYPARLYGWVEKLLAGDSPLKNANFVCTIKQQGQGDMDTVRKFASIPGGQVVHLYHNKHELTFLRTCSKLEKSINNRKGVLQ
jgi:23S rRNA (cytidine2498-2'-O)-methyltransferase